MGKRTVHAQKQEGFIPRIPVMIIGILLLMWAYFVLKEHFAGFPVLPQYLNYIFETNSYPGLEAPERVRVILGNVLSLVLAGFFLLSYYGAGAWLLARMKIKDTLSILEKSVLSFCIGTGAVIIYTIIIGSIGLLYKWVVVASMLPGALFGYIAMVNTFKEVRIGKQQKSRMQKFSILEKILGIVLVFAVFLRLLGAMAPETFYDSQYYHLSIPLYWIQHHKISIVPYIWNSFFPLNIHVLYTGSFVFMNDVVVKLIHFALSFLSFWVVFAIGRRWISRKAALFSAVMFYTVPMGIVVSYRSGIEMGIAFFETCAVFCLLMYMAGREKNWKWLLLAGANCGIAVGSKYTSIMCFVSALCGLFTYGLIEKYSFKKYAKMLSVFIMAVLVFGGVWYIRNYAITGNPVFPQLYGKLSNYTGDVNTNNILGDITSDRPMAGMSIFRRLLVPWDMNKGSQPEGYSGAAVLLLLPLLLLLGKVPKYVKVLLVYFSAYYLLWIVSAGYLRYFIPALPVICLILSAYVNGLENNLLLKKVLQVTVVILFLSNINFVMRMQKVNNDPLGVVMGLQSKYDYLSKSRPSYPSPYYSGIDWVNKNTAPESKVLFVGESRAMFSNRKFVVSGVYNNNPLVEWTRQAKTAGELYRKFKAEKVTHILYNLPEAMRLWSFRIFDWSPQERKPFDKFWEKYVKQVYGQKWIFVYEILSEEEANKPHKVPQNYISNLPQIIEQQKRAKR